MVREFIEKACHTAEDAVARLEDRCAAPVIDASATAARHAGTDPAAIKDMAHRKVVEIVNEFVACTELFARAGFCLQNFDVEVGISPKLIPRFYVTRIPEEAERQKLLDQVKSKRLIHAILNGLFKTADLQRYFHIGEMNLVGIEVHAATMPTIRMLFGNRLPQVQ